MRPNASADVGFDRCDRSLAKPPPRDREHQQHRTKPSDRAQHVAHESHCNHPTKNQRECVERPRVDSSICSRGPRCRSRREAIEPRRWWLLCRLSGRRIGGLANVAQSAGRQSTHHDTRDDDERDDYCADRADPAAPRTEGLASRPLHATDHPNAEWGAENETQAHYRRSNQDCEPADESGDSIEHLRARFGHVVRGVGTHAKIWRM